MKKYILQIVLISFIFLYENTYTYWIHKLEKWTSLTHIVYSLIFVCAIGFTINNLIKFIQIKLKDRKLNILTLSMIAILIIPFLMPRGLISKKVLYKGELLVAFLDGVAGNNGWLTLYGNNTYEYNYGTELLSGKYKVKKDTIYFDSSKNGDNYNFEYATLWDDKSHLSFGKDSIGYFYMKIIKNELIK